MAVKVPIRNGRGNYSHSSPVVRDDLWYRLDDDDCGVKKPSHEVRSFRRLYNGYVPLPSAAAALVLKIFF